MIIDFYVCYSRPSLKIICIGLLIYGIFYPAFTAIWQWQSGWAIYPFTDWMNDAVGTSIMMVVLTVLGLTVTVIQWWTKRILIRKCAPQREEVEMAERMHSRSVDTQEVSSGVET